MTTSLQVCFGESAMGSLIQAGYTPVIAFAQLFDGPLQDFKTYEDYENAFQEFLIDMCTENSEYKEIFPVPLFSYRQGPNLSKPLASSDFTKIMNESDEIIVWVSLSFHENLLLAFMIRLLTLYFLPLEKIKVRKIETLLTNGKSEKTLGIGMIPPQEMKAAAPPTALDQSEIDLLIKGWDAITSPEPEKMDAYLSLPPTTRFQEGLRDFQNRLPSSKTGLNRCQTELLEAYPLNQASVNANWLVGTALGKRHDMGHLDRLYDLYVIWNLMQMTNLHAPKPAFIITDPYTREHQVAITDFGRILRESKANWQDYNPTDYYVGGLHIHSTPPSPQREP